MQEVKEAAGSIKIQFRFAAKEDESFIYNSWLKSFRDSDSVKHITNTVFYKRHHALIEKLMTKSSVLLAVNPEDPSQIMGYVCFDVIDDVLLLHYVYVKQTYRSLNVATSLLKAVNPNFGKTGFVFTQMSKTGKSLYTRYLGVYDPYLID